jgi:alpha-1,2-mannosyltransferase
VFWTDALWNTGRVGQLEFISNQSLNGAVARLNESDPSTLLWLAAVAAVVALWVVRVRRAVAAGDEVTGFALTGVVGCLISPITWVHHLVWVGPAIILLLDSALTAPRARRRRWLLGVAGASYLVLCSRLVWVFQDRWDNPAGWLLSNAYVWVSLTLLVALPIRRQVADRAIEAATGEDGDGYAGAGPRGGATVASAGDAGDPDRELALARRAS